MDWVDDLHARHAAGENPVDLYAEYQTRIAEEKAAKPKGVTRGMERLVEAWDSKDWERLEADGWLTTDGTHLTSEATRLLITAWDVDDTASL